MKKPQTSPNFTPAGQTIPRSRALIALPTPVQRRGLLATIFRTAVLILLLPVRIPLLAAALLVRGIAAAGRGIGQGLAATGRGLVGVARLVAWVLLLPVRIVVLLARLVALLAKGLARALVFVLRLPFVVLRLLGRGAFLAARGTAYAIGAVAVAVGSLAWGSVRFLAAGVAAVARGVGIAFAFAGRLLLRGVVLVGRGVFGTFAALAVGIFVCLRWTVRLAFRLVLLPFVVARILAVYLARGVRNGAALFFHAGIVVAVGLSQIVRALLAMVLSAGYWTGRAARPTAAALRTRDPQKSILLPLGTLVVVGVAELLRSGGFPFATCAMLLVGSCALLSLMSNPAGVSGVLLAWGLAVSAGWRAESVASLTPAWLDALIYIAALGALRAAYVAARAFVRAVPATPREPKQERAHRRASRAIGVVIAAQCVAFALWSAAEGRFLDAPLFGELLLVGAGMALAWVVRSGQYVRTAQFVLTIGALGAMVVAIAAQFRAFGAGRVVTATSLGAFVLLLLVTAGLTVVVHTRLIDAEHGA